MTRESHFAAPWWRLGLTASITFLLGCGDRPVSPAALSPVTPPPPPFPTIAALALDPVSDVLTAQRRSGAIARVRALDGAGGLLAARSDTVTIDLTDASGSSLLEAQLRVALRNGELAIDNVRALRPATNALLRVTVGSLVASRNGFDVVSARPDRILADEPFLRGTVGTTVALKNRGMYADGEAVTAAALAIRVDDPSIARVEGSGSIRLVAPGQTMAWIETTGGEVALPILSTTPGRVLFAVLPMPGAQLAGAVSPGRRVLHQLYCIGSPASTVTGIQSSISLEGGGGRLEVLSPSVVRDWRTVIQPDSLRGGVLGLGQALCSGESPIATLQIVVRSAAVAGQFVRIVPKAVGLVGASGANLLAEAIAGSYRFNVR